MNLARKYCLSTLGSQTFTQSSMNLARKHCLSILGSQTVSHFSTTSQIRKEVNDKSTVDREDIITISKFATDWWNPEKLKVLHALNSVRIKFVTDGVATTGIKAINPDKPLEGLKLLDVGCGGGIVSEPLARLGADVTGIDVSVDLLSIAVEHATLDARLKSNLTYRNITIEDLAKEKKEHYDVVVASEILEHVDNPSLFLKGCSEVLKPNGSIFVTTLNRNLKSWLVAKLSLEYILRIIPIGIHDWKKFITPEETKQLLDKYNCDTKSVQGFSYNPFQNKWSYVPSPAVFYGLYAIKQANK